MNGNKSLTTSTGKQITPAQLRKINTIISMRGICKETKEAMVLGFSAGRSNSSKNLYFIEASELIKHLEAGDPQKEAINKMRGKVLYYAHEMGWHTLKNGKYVADIIRVDNWCLKYGFIKRKLDGYSFQELPRLVSQFEAVYQGFLSNF
jgi:hypothetical protein